MELTCDFGGLSLGAENASLSVIVAKEAETIAKMDKMFCGSRLEVTLGYDTEAPEDPKQKKLVDAVVKLDSVVDCKRLGSTPAQYSLTLAFAIEDVDMPTLTRFHHQKQGRLIAKRIGKPSED